MHPIAPNRCVKNNVIYHSHFGIHVDTIATTNEIIATPPKIKNPLRKKSNGFLSSAHYQLQNLRHRWRFPRFQECVYRLRRNPAANPFLDMFTTLQSPIRQRHHFAFLVDPRTATIAPMNQSIGENEAVPVSTHNPIAHKPCLLYTSD